MRFFTSTGFAASAGSVRTAILEIAADDSPNDWVDREGKDGQTGRVVNRDNIQTSQASDRGLKVAPREAHAHIKRNV
jgi:hypothetical protein